jgi:UDP-N-acetylglucosamine 1-carboxyvinyltransferase
MASMASARAAPDALARRGPRAQPAWRRPVRHHAVCARVRRDARLGTCAYASSSAPAARASGAGGGGYLAVEGDARLSGLVRVGGAKNAVLALLAGTLACSEPVTLTNVPDLRDVRSMIAVLESVGAKVTRPNDSPDDRAGGVDGTLRVDCSRITTSAFTIDTVSKLRASFFAAGPMLARTGRVEMPLPGGCAIGARPVDLHLRGFEALGARVRVTEEGTVVATTAVGDDDDADGACRSTAPLRGRAEMSLRFPSVGATHSLMTAAALAEGTTVIRGAAAEPEVADLAAMLNAAGADIRGAGTDTITVRGVGDAKAAARMANDSKKKGVLDVASVASLGGCAHRAIPDRIEAGTFLVAAAVTRSSIELEPVILNHVRSTMDVLEAFGCAFETSAVSEKSRTENENETSREVRLRVIPPASRTDARPVTFATAPFPGVPTDMQPQLCVLASAASGVSFCRETVFESRVAHVEQLRLMGVDAVAEGETVTVRGGATTGESEVSDEQNAYAYETRDVFGSDLRATAALVLAGLCAKGTTRVFGLEHLDRGYERLDEKLRALGADVARREE